MTQFETAYNDIYKLHTQLLDTSRTRIKPTLVVFSAIPGSGKSELTKRLVSEHNFLRIANKDVRELIAKTHHEDDVSVEGYTLWLLDNLTEQTKYSIVFDRNIDQWYTPSKEWAERNGYRYVLVRIDVQREILEQRLLEREKDREAKAFEVLDFYAKQHEEIGIQIDPSITLSDNYDLDAAAKAIVKF